MLEDAKVGTLITEEKLFSNFNDRISSVILLDKDHKKIAKESRENPNREASNLAYVIYTSGSTGNPKGVMISHRNLSHYVQAIKASLKIEMSDVYLHTASFAFSSSVRQFAIPLACGASVVVASVDQIRDPGALFELIQKRGVTILDIVPSYWQSCTRALSRLDPSDRMALLKNQLRLILSASEPLSIETPIAWLSETGHSARLINMYGQTETTGIVSIYPIEISNKQITKTTLIGRPISNTQLYVLDSTQKPVPANVVGELYAGGDGVGLGYFNQPELTAERFIRNPFTAKTDSFLYRTGDLARIRPDGNIEFVGRIDHQIKIRGFRIEPAEIERFLNQHSGVKECTVVAVKDSDHSQRLVAYYVVNDRTEFPMNSLSTALREIVKRNLPEYMIPAEFVELLTLPRVPSGKVDRKQLCARSSVSFAADSQSSDRTKVRKRSRPKLDTTFELPRHPAESMLKEIWCDVLQLDEVSIHDNFFELGGDSFLSVQILHQANEAGLRISYKQFFQHQTIAELAQVIQPGPARTITHSNSVIPVTVESLRAFGREALERAGLSPEGAAIVTEVQLESSLRGQLTHNMESIPRYVRRIASGSINADPKIQIVNETEVSAVIDGDNGPGQWVSVVAMQLAIKKAKQTGIGTVGVRSSNHFGAAGHYAWMASLQNLIGISTSNAGVWIAPTGGLTPTFGNNPFSVGIPAGKDYPILLDISMSVAPKGKIGLHVAQGKQLPPGWIFDQFGQPSAELADLAAGLGIPIGGHKGYGLTFVMEVLAGALTGAGFCLDHNQARMRDRRKPSDIGHFFMAINPELFMPLHEFSARIDQMILQTKTGKKMENIEEIFFPGEREMRERERNVKGSVPLSLSTFQLLERHRKAAGLITNLVVAPEKI